MGQPTFQRDLPAPGDVACDTGAEEGTLTREGAMSDRIHVTMALDLFIEDSQAMRQAAFERLQSAWSGDEDFPYESSDDVPLTSAVHSVLADALPAELPGCRRSQLDVEVEESSGKDSKAAADDEKADDSDDADSDPASSDADEGEHSDDNDRGEDEDPSEKSRSSEESDEDNSSGDDRSTDR